MFDTWNQGIVEIADQYGVPVARVDQEFNGPDGDQGPGDKEYVSTDGLHTVATPGTSSPFRITNGNGGCDTRPSPWPKPRRSHR